MQASLARPSTGGAVNAIFKASPSSPTIAFFFPRGCTLTTKLTPAALSFIGIMPKKLNNPGPWMFPRDPLCPLWLSFRPLSKNPCPHSHTSRSLFNRHFEIMRHPHRKHLHSYPRQTSPSNLIAQFPQLPEVRPRLLRILGKRRHGHQSAKLKMLQARHPLQQFLQLLRFRGHSALRSLPSNIDLNQHRDLLPKIRRRRIQPLCQPQRIHRIHPPQTVLLPSLPCSTANARSCAIPHRPNPPAPQLSPQTPAPDSPQTAATPRHTPREYVPPVASCSPPSMKSQPDPSRHAAQPRPSAAARPQCCSKSAPPAIPP